MKKKLISILIPFYNEAGLLPSLLQEIKLLEKKHADKYNFEIILLDNHSNDDSTKEAKQLSKKYNNIILIRQARNFGYQANIMAGYNLCNGDAAVQLDADGEDNPALISDFLIKWEEGYKVVYGIREMRKSGKFITLCTKIFYRFLNLIADINIPIDAGDFRLLDKQIIKTLKKFNEKNIYIRGIISYIGYNQIGIKYNRRKRKLGKSKFIFFSYLKLAFVGIISFSKKPLMFIFVLGVCLFLISIALLIFYLFLFFTGKILVPGFMSIIAFLLLFFALIIISIGIVALYLGQILDEVKNRPIYIIEKKDKKK